MTFSHQYPFDYAEEGHGNLWRNAFWRIASLR
ncbi:MAG: hypothetical protein RLZZ251_668 [Actinomycetota bacterium]|jgi:hypothetical protein